jgi:hypothetical protein
MGGKSSKSTSNHTENNNKLVNSVYNQNNVNISLKDSINKEQHTENVKNLISNVVALTMTDIMSDMNFNFDQHNQAVLKFAKDPATGQPCQYDTIKIKIVQKNKAELEVKQTVTNISNTDISTKVSKKMVATIDMATQLVKKLGLENLIKNDGNSDATLNSKTNSLNEKSETTNSGIGGTMGKAIDGIADVAGSMFAFGASKSESDNNTCINNTDIRDSITNKNTKNISKDSKYNDVVKDINETFEEKNSNEKAVNNIANKLKVAMGQKNSFAMMDIPCAKKFDATINQENNMLGYIRQTAVSTVINEMAKEMTENSLKEIDRKFTGDTRQELKNAMKNVTKLASEASSSMTGSNSRSMEDKEGAIEAGMGSAIKGLGEGIGGGISGAFKIFKYIPLIIIGCLIIFVVMKLMGSGGGDQYYKKILSRNNDLNNFNDL